jgi:hypothetical protein
LILATSIANVSGKKCPSETRNRRHIRTHPTLNQIANIIKIPHIIRSQINLSKLKNLKKQCLILTRPPKKNPRNRTQRITNSKSQ